jgi:methionyl aminopeptidase
MRPPRRLINMIVLKTSAELARMREAGKVVARVHAAMRNYVRAGVTLAELDAIAEDIIRGAGMTPSFKGYLPDGMRGTGTPPFPATICASVNDEVVHGIPGSRKLKEGDIFKIDVACIHQGYHADAASTLAVGRVSQQAQDLMAVTELCLANGIAACRAGQRFGDVGYAVQHTAESRGFSVVQEYSSHGVGRQLHEGFSMLNTGVPGTGMLMRPGLTIALEPMINAGTHLTYVKKDRWTVATKDGKLSAHFEHTVAVTDGEPEILTRAE